jgi:hypothetical protein
MAYSSGTAADHDELITDLFAFATANGFTQDQLDTSGDEAALHLTAGGNAYFSFDWDEANRIGLYHAKGYTGGQSPGDHPNDSGNGQPNRVLLINNVPVNYDFFSDGSTYVHAVFEYQSPALNFNHLSFGLVNKKGTWTGGSYIVGTAWGINSGVTFTPLDARHYLLWDGLNNQSGAYCGTLNMEGLPNQAASGKYGVIGGAISFIQLGVDGDGIDRELVHGGVRGGFLYSQLNFLAANPTNGFVPLWPIELYYREDSTIWRALGTAPDVRGVNITNLSPREEFTVGADTWKTYPWIQKSNTGTGSESGLVNGLAYKKIP